MRDLTHSAAGRNLIKQADILVGSAGDSVSHDIEAIGRLARSTEPENYLARQSAAIILAEIAKQAREESTNDFYLHRSPLYRKAQRIHTWLDDFMSRHIRSRAVVSRLPWRRSAALHWGWISNLLTLFAAAALLFFSNFGVAVVLVGLRVLVTVVVWSIDSYPGDEHPTRPVLETDPRIEVLGHGGDLLLFVALGMALVENNHHPMGFLALTAGSFIVFGTLVRLTASTSGLAVPRLHVERMFRGGGILAALFLASIASVSWWWPVFPLMLPIAFAVVEIQESLRAFGITRTNPLMAPDLSSPTDGSEPTLRSADLAG